MKDAISEVKNDEKMKQRMIELIKQIIENPDGYDLEIIDEAKSLIGLLR